MSKSRFGNAKKAAWLGIASNAVLAGLKGTAGYAAGSYSLMADAAASVSSVANSATALAGIGANKRLSEGDSLNGQSKPGAVTSIILAALMILIGFEIGKSSLFTIMAGTEQAPGIIALAAIIIAILVKEGLIRYHIVPSTREIVKAQNNWSWERRLGRLAAFMAGAGILGAQAGKWLDLPQLYNLDPAAGLIVSAIVLFMSGRMIRESVQRHADQAIGDEDASELVKTVQRVKGIITVDGLKAREHGHYVIVDVKISVNPRISVAEGHEIAKITKQHLMARFSHVSEVLVQVNPYDPGYPYKNNMDPEQDEIPTLLH